jgi:hypothetical protein
MTALMNAQRKDEQNKLEKSKGESCGLQNNRSNIQIRNKRESSGYSIFDPALC